MPRRRGPKKAAELFETPYAEQLTALFAAQKFKGRPPESSTELLGRLIDAGHFPWLKNATPGWVTSLIDGGPAYHQYLADLQEEINKIRRNNLEEAARIPGATKRDAGKLSGTSRRDKAKSEMDAVVRQYVTSTIKLAKKPDAFVVATWHIQQTAPDLVEPERKRQIRNLTKRLRGVNSAT